MPFSGAPLLPYLIYCRSFLLPFAPDCSLHPAVSAPSSALCGKTGVRCEKALESCGFFSRLISSSLGAACPSFPRSHPHYPQYPYYIYTTLSWAIVQQIRIWVGVCSQKGYLFANKMRTRCKADTNQVCTWWLPVSS